MDPNTPNDSISDMNELRELYENISIVNKSIVSRIENYKKDYEPDKNALVILDSFTQILALEWETNFESLTYLYENTRVLKSFAFLSSFARALI